MKSQEKNQRGKKKVFVAMSGGVDSSVSAALLKERGFDVHGVFIKIWSPYGDYCSISEDRRDAMRVAARIGMPFSTIDLSEEYRTEVAERMISEYGAGRTPNPDVVCNARIKFGAFFDWAISEGADYVATGHYARVHTAGGRTYLLTGLDKNKDQTYFLWTLSQDTLKKTIFPVGEYQKHKVRELARSFNLPVADKKDSQGLCFLGRVDMRDFLKENLGVSSGKVLSAVGEDIGEHDGVELYTIGQRSGFRARQTGPDSKPLYVVRKDLLANTITVAARDESVSLRLLPKKITIVNCNWISGRPDARKMIAARVRYRQPLEHCSAASPENGSAIVEFKNPQYAAAGQSIVFYDGDRCLGGGVIA